MLPLVAFVAVAVALVLVIQRTSDDFLRANNRSLAAQAVVADLRQLLSLAQDLETGQRGFLLTGDTTYLEPYQRALPELPAQLARLDRQVQSVPAIGEELQRISGLLAQRQVVIDSTVALRKAGDVTEANALMRADREKRLMDEVRRSIGTAEAAAQATLTEARASAEEQHRRTTLAAIVAAVSGMLLAVAAGVTMQNELLARRRERDWLSRVELDLADRVDQTSTRLARREEQLRAIVAAVPVAVVALDLTGKVSFWSPGAERLFGWTAEEIVGLELQIIPPDLQEEYARFRQEVLSGQPFTSRDTQRLHRSGARIDVTLSTALLHDDNGGPAGLVAAYIDTSAQRLLAEQLRQSQKLEAIGRLAGGVAHDFNNLLTVILGSAEHALSRLPPAERRREDLLEITDTAERAVALTRQLLAFSRPRPMNPRVLDVAMVVRRMEGMLRRLMEERFELRFVTAADAGRVRADPHHLEQVLMNLCVNARDAMPDGGRILVETARVELDRDYTDAHPGLVPGEYTMLSVTDTGLGMDEATQQRIFEPFFTTKGHGLGTGLGLATVQGIVKEAGGGIMVYSEPGRGSTFKVYLPLVESALPHDTPSPAHQPAPSAPATIRRARVLLVEDNPQVRALAVAMLEEEGLQVTACDSGEKALGLAAMAEPPELLITDLVLGGMSGVELRERLRERIPGLPSIFMSGYTEESQEVAAVVADPMARFLEKPFRRAVLVELVGELLAAYDEKQAARRSV